MSSESQKSKNPHAKRLGELRDRLLTLHKTLIESERVGYENTFGTLSSPYAFLQRVINDPWFAWLHPLSEMIVVIDELLEEKEPLTAEKFDEIAKQTRVRLQVSEEGQGFSRSYFEALQRDPDVVFAHAAVMKQLNEGK